ncbi:MAG: HNH endonuclease signature motif containing protein [Pseudomonadota bacterium]
MTSPPAPVKRRALNLSQKLEVMMARALCPGCFKPFKGKAEFDHIQALSANGADDTDNLQPLCPACHKDKTRTDNKRAKKNARLRGETGQRKRREARGGSSIQSRGFQTNRDSRFKQKLNGKIEVRS